jgi:predicted ATPase with chaperone activity
VSLEGYRRFLRRQLEPLPEPRPADVEGALASMVLPAGAVRLAGLAVASGRSLFLYGQPGNGKTTLGRLLHGALRGDFWVPDCIAVGESIVRVFDPLCHRPVAGARSPGIDGRWVRIRRPLVTVGGELTIDSLDAAYSETTRTYEAPIHVKSNGGVLLIDDFGRQRVAPHELLNRWIVPLEYGVDHLTLRTGQQIQVPFRQTLVFATNLDLGLVTDSAFLRRIGYRLELRSPGEEEYAEIFRRQAAARGVAVPPGTVESLLERYRGEGRDLRACHPRDLIDRALDLRRFEGTEPGLDGRSLELAWLGYFGEA